jgi:glyoxylase-like metal-dependent hydrolase (beta-lactamase superfamily II)
MNLRFLAAALVVPALFAAGVPVRADQVLDGFRAKFAQSPIETKQLAPSLYALSGPGGNMTVLVGAEKAFMVDSGILGRTKDIIAAVEKLHAGGIGWVVNTHYHFDHTDGNVEMAKQGAAIISQDQLRDRLMHDQALEFVGMKIPASPEAAWPAHTYSAAMTFHRDGQTIRLTYIPDAHTDGDTVVFFENANVIATGDLFFNGIYPLIDYSAKGWIGGMIAGVNQILAMSNDKTQIVPGHGAVATKADLRAYREMLETVEDRLMTYAAQGKSPDEVVALKPTADFDAKWGKGFLNGDVFTRMAYTGLLRHK